MSSASPTHAGSGKPEGKDMGPFGGMPSAGGSLPGLFFFKSRQGDCQLGAPDGLVIQFSLDTGLGLCPYLPCSDWGLGYLGVLT